MRNSSFGTVFYDKQYTISPTKFSFTLCTKIMIKIYSKGIDKQAFIWYTCKAFYFTLVFCLVKDVYFMFEKNLNVGYLLDFYGVLLSERKRSVMEMYYNEDFSLAEVAEEIGISRQGVRDLIKKSEDELFFYEEKLGLAKKLREVEKESTELRALAESAQLPEDIRNKIVSLAELIRQ